MKHTGTIIIAACLAFCMAQLPGFNVPPEKPVTVEPVHVPYFNEGQILEPSYACSDTLVVVDAEGLNRDMGAIEQGLIEATDGEIDSVLHLYCTIKK